MSLAQSESAGEPNCNLTHQSGKDKLVCSHPSLVGIDSESRGAASVPSSGFKTARGVRTCPHVTWGVACTSKL
eukprot:2660553-Amphidinium_carterae.1